MYYGEFENREFNEPVKNLMVSTMLIFTAANTGVADVLIVYIR